MIPSDSAIDKNEHLIDEAVAEYLRAEAAGQAGDRQAWLDRYPECAEFLAAFFDDREQMNRVISPIRIATTAAEGDGEPTGIYSPALFGAPRLPI